MRPPKVLIGVLFAREAVDVNTAYKSNRAGLTGPVANKKMTNEGNWLSGCGLGCIDLKPRKSVHEVAKIVMSILLFFQSGGVDAVRTN